MNIRTPIFAFAAIITPASISQADDAQVVNAFNHIVVIVQENHSFDNLYGLWGEVNGHRVNAPFKIEDYISATDTTGPSSSDVLPRMG